MNKQIVAIMIGTFLISLTSALTYNITAGDSISFMLSEDFDYYSIVGNQSEINLNITQDGLNITILIGKYSTADSFEIIFFNKEKEIVKEYYGGGGGGGGSTRYVDRNITTYVDREVYIEDEDEEEIIRNTVNYFGIAVCILIIAALILVLILTNKKQNEK